MRIAFLTSLSVRYPYLTGRVLPLARELIRAGHQVQILALHDEWRGRTETTAYFQGVVVHQVGPMHVRGLGDSRRQLRGAELLRVALFSTIRLAWAASHLEVDLYHIGKPLPFNSVAGLIAARLGHRALYVDCDDYEAASTRFTGRWQRGIVRWFEDRLPRMATGVTANTHFWQDRLVHTLGLPREMVAYVPNGVDVGRFASSSEEAVQQLRRQFGLEGKAAVVYVGILSLIGHPLDLLLEAFALVARTLPQAHLVLVGGGEDGPALRHRVAEMGLAERVTFTGLVPAEAVAAYYRLGACSVDPARDDLHARARCPLKVLESMACGVPVVTGDVGDRRELLGGDRAGLLVQPGDAAALAEGLRALLADQELRAQLSRGACEQAERYRWERLVGDVVQLYERTMWW